MTPGPDEAPFDRIVAAAAMDRVPEEFLRQLRDRGWFLGPVGRGARQRFTRIDRRGEAFVASPLLPVLFVPMRSP